MQVTSMNRYRIAQVIAEVLSAFPYVTSGWWAEAPIDERVYRCLFDLPK